MTRASHARLAGFTFFAIGSSLFSWLLLRGQMIPMALASPGVIASALLVAILPLQAAGRVGVGGVTTSIWLPMLVFEVTLAVWLVARGVSPPAQRRAA